MLTDDQRQVIAAIHGAPPRLVYAFAGAGSLALYWLHAVPGSSRTILEARDCYAPRALAELAGGVPTHAVSASTARAMASWALARAAALLETTAPVLGVACTAAIATDRTRRGPDHAVVVVEAAAGAVAYELVMARELRDRASQEQLVSQLVIWAVAGACTIPTSPLELLPGERLGEVV